MPRFDVVTFDCYGTLIDWERGIGDAFASAAAREGRTLDRRSVLAAYAAIEPEIEAGPYHSYRDTLRMTGVRVAQRCGWDWKKDDDDATFLPESLPAWTPFPDTNSSLTRLASAGVKLGILSNVDEDLLAATRRHFPVTFDLIVTAERVRSYKPGHAHFLEARSRLGSARWLHAAQSYFHDVVPCKELGIPIAWINRKGEAAGPRGNADFEFRDLATFAEWMAGAGRA